VGVPEHLDTSKPTSIVIFWNPKWDVETWNWHLKSNFFEKTLFLAFYVSFFPIFLLSRFYLNFLNPPFIVSINCYFFQMYFFILRNFSFFFLPFIYIFFLP
jgi:hypothetical protein